MIGKTNTSSGGGTKVYIDGVETKAKEVDIYNPTNINLIKPSSVVIALTGTTYRHFGLALKNEDYLWISSYPYNSACGPLFSYNIATSLLTLEQSSFCSCIGSDGNGNLYVSQYKSSSESYIYKNGVKIATLNTYLGWMESNATNGKIFCYGYGDGWLYYIDTISDTVVKYMSINRPFYYSSYVSEATPIVNTGTYIFYWGSSDKQLIRTTIETKQSSSIVLTGGGSYESWYSILQYNDNQVITLGAYNTAYYNNRVDISTLTLVEYTPGTGYTQLGATPNSIGCYNGASYGYGKRPAAYYHGHLLYLSPNTAYAYSPATLSATRHINPGVRATITN